MKNLNRLLTLSSILVCGFILQGCSSDSADDGVSGQTVSDQYAPTRVESGHKQYYYAPTDGNNPANSSGYYRQPATGYQPSRDYNSGQGETISGPAQRQKIEYYESDAPAAAKSPDYNNAVTTPVVKRQSDMEWVNSQHPGSYTIEVATDPKRSKVAYTVFKSPKAQRTAQFGYKNNDQKVYTGVYGTYKTKEEAQQALDALPSDVKQSATVQQWQNVQTKAAAQEPDEKPSVESPASNQGSSNMEWSKDKQ